MSSETNPTNNLWLDHKVKAINNAGIDALTMVATSTFGNAELRAIWNGWLEDSQDSGRIQPWRMLDIKGTQFNSLKIGANKHGMLVVQAMGEAARYVLDVSPKLSEQRLTRVDLCVDVQYLPGEAPDLKKWYNHPRIVKINDDHRKYWMSPTGETLYLGSRRGASMIRVYDKSLAYELDLKTVYRFEVEYKKVRSKRVAKLLEEGKYDIAKISLDLVRETCRQRGILAPWNTLGQEVSFPRVEIGISSDDTRLSWMMQISGAIREFVHKSPKNEAKVRQLFDLPLAKDVTNDK